MIAPTPTTNTSLPFRTEGFRTLAEGLDYAACGETGFNFFSPRGQLQHTLSYRALRDRALDLASRLAGTRLMRGDRVGIIAETTVDFVSIFFACQYAGLVPVPLPLSINFGGHDAYVERLRGMLKAAGARAAVAPKELLSVMQEAARPTAASLVTTAEELETMPAVELPEPLGPEDPCYIQYSSGSTSFPRGVLVSQKAIAANARDIATHGLALGSSDRCTSWLPLYHDMGLVGCCLTPVMAQVSVDYLPTTAFARRPFLWLELISRYRGTISFGPTFGYELCARRAAHKQMDDLDLSSWRVAGIGGEMIRPQALEQFADTFAKNGFDATAFLPSYGMAEATLAVTFSSLDSRIETDRIARGVALEREKQAVPVHNAHPMSRRFVFCGRAMPGYDVQIRDDIGRPLPDRRVGRICLKGPSLMQGYFRNPDATDAVMLPDGWLDSGDMGYMVDGKLVVTGRTKDLIIVGGRNIWPQDLEWAIEQLDGVRAGDVAAFAVTGRDEVESVVVVVECRARSVDERTMMREAVSATVQRVAGVPCQVVLAPTRSLTFTTSGKLSRAAARDHYLGGMIRDIDEVEETSGDTVLAATG